MNTCTNCCWMKGKFNMATHTMSLTGMTTYIGELLAQYLVPVDRPQWSPIEPQSYATNASC
jgi:hypothetical protein